MLDNASEQRIQALLDLMTFEEKITIIGGADAWRTHAIPRAGVPAIKVTDGPHGARGGTFGEYRAASFPCGTALGATWNPELIRKVGAAIGDEARTKQCHVLLGPTLNIHRHPLAGRNFECYSEDPFLVSAIGVAFIQGVQSRGVAATAKHFVCNDSEFERMSISSEVGERALHEIYLPPFEAAVKDGHAWAAMTAYNRINGTYASEHPQLISLLKDEWGFDGLLMSDWWGTYSTACAEAGLDLEMPGRARFFGRRLQAAIDAGEVSTAVFDDKVRRLLRLAVRTGAIDGPPESEEQSIEQPEHRALMRRVVADSIVLLKNEGSLLPLSLSSGTTIALIGPNADLLCMQGGGSSAVEPHRVTSLAGALRAELGPGVTIEYEPGCDITRRAPALGTGLTTPDGSAGVAVEFFDNPDLEGEPALRRVVPRFEMRWIANSVPLAGQFSLRGRATFSAPKSGVYQFSLTSAGLSRFYVDGSLLIDNWTSQEPGTSFYGAGSSDVTTHATFEAGSSHEVVLEFQSPGRAGIPGVNLGCRFPAEANPMDRAVELARRADSVVLVAGLTPEWEAEGRDRGSLSLPGRQDELIRRVLEVNQRTVVVLNAGSPVAMPWEPLAPAILQLWFPGQEGGEGLSDVLLGGSDPGGRLPTTFAHRVEDHPSHLTYPGEAGRVHYGEDVFVGYRAFERLKREPLFAFGHGLSYTAFELGQPSLDQSRISPGDSVSVGVPIANTGSRPGSTVVQVYVRDMESTLLRPEKELKGFAKVSLAPGERTTASIELSPRAFEAWDPGLHRWVAEPGEFEILVGLSSSQVSGSATLTLLASGELAGQD